MSATSGKPTSAPETRSNWDMEFQSGGARDFSPNLLNAELRASVSQNELEFARQEINRFRAKLEASENENASLRDEMASMSTELISNRNLQVKLVDQCQSLKNELKAIQDSRGGLGELKSKLERRERRLRIYADLLRGQQKQLQRVADELHQEIASGQSLHPMKDYLKLTEFELKKVELQLPKTPMISEERPQLEATFKHLIEQRDFLQTIISASQMELNERVTNIEAISRKGNSIVTPPPPPSGSTAKLDENDSMGMI